MLKIDETRYLRGESIDFKISKSFFDFVDALPLGESNVLSSVRVEKTSIRYGTLVFCSDEETGEHVTGFSVCNEADVFSAKKGKEIALERAKARLSKYSDLTSRVFLSEDELRLFGEDREKVIDCCSKFYKKILK